MKKNKQSGFSFVGFLLFFIPLAISITFGITIYNRLMEKYSNTIKTTIYMTIYVTFISLVFSLIDLLRRKWLVDKPVTSILDATNQIANGNFNIYINSSHSYPKQTEFDVIIENINKMAKALSHSEILGNDFVSNVSHEIKTPLTIISNYAKALQNHKLDKTTKEEYLQTLIRTSNKLSNLITNILKLNKLENQVIVPKEEKIKLDNILQECIIQYDNQLNDKNIILDCDIDQVEFVSDSSYIEIVFNNLISNAIKFSKDNGKIKISLKENNNQIEFRIKDNGCGIPKDKGNRIFEKFYQIDTSHSSEGNGLGLALVKKIIDILGGTISVESEENKGSTFQVTFKR